MTKRLTVNQLHKITAELLAQGHGRRVVCVAKETFFSNLESDGATILEAHDCRIATIHVADDDGGTASNADGSERYTTVAILFGNNDERTLGVPSKARR